MPLTLAQAHVVGGLLLVLAVGVVIILWLLHLKHNHQRRTTGTHTKTALQHVRTHAVHHISAGVAAVIGVAFLLVAGTAAVLVYKGGARFDTHKRIPPPHVLPHGGGSSGTAPPNLSLYLPGVENQDDTNACWSFSTMEALYAAEHQRSAQMPVPSPWRTFWYGASPQGSNSTGTLEQAIAAINSRGVEPISDWPVIGGPDAHDEGVTTAYQAASVRYVYYGVGYGTSTVAAITAELDAGHLLVLLWHVYANALRNGQYVIDNGGAEEFYHFVVAYGYVRNADGTISLAIRNSWGPAWGSQGNALMPQSVVIASVLAAAVISPGHPVPAAVWLPVQPTATPIPPLPTATARPRPTATPLPPISRQLTGAANLRISPAKGAKVLAGLAKGTRVTDLRVRSGTWDEVKAGTRTGWIPIAVLGGQP